MPDDADEELETPRSGRSRVAGRFRRRLPAAIAILMVLAAFGVGLAALAGEELYRVYRLDRHLRPVQEHAEAAAAAARAEAASGTEYALGPSAESRRRFRTARSTMSAAVERLENDFLYEFSYDYVSIDTVVEDVRNAHEAWVPIVEARGRFGRAAGRIVQFARCKEAIAKAAEPVEISTDPIVTYSNREIARLWKEEAEACRKDPPELMSDDESARLATEELRAGRRRLADEIATLLAAIPPEKRAKAKDVDDATGRFGQAAGLALALGASAWILDRIRRRIPVRPRPLYLAIVATRRIRRRRSLVVAWTARIAGTVLVACATVAGFGTLGAIQSDLPVGGRLAIGAGLTSLAAVVGGVGGLLWQLGKKRFSEIAAEEVVGDARPPVLYLRSFADDPIAAQTEDAPGLFARRFTEEDQIAQAVGRIGPFVGLGDPGERTPPVGASRFHLPDEGWQDRILELLDAARLVLIRLGGTSSLWWEIEQAMQRVEPERLVLLVPFGHDAYEAFRGVAAVRLPHELPPGPRVDAAQPAREPGKVRALIVFDPDWRAHLVPLEMRDQLPRSFFRSLTKALRPSVARLGVPAHRSTAIRAADVVVLAVTAAGAVLTVFVLVRLVQLLYQ